MTQILKEQIILSLLKFGQTVALLCLVGVFGLLIISSATKQKCNARLQHQLEIWASTE